MLGLIMFFIYLCSPMKIEVLYLIASSKNFNGNIEEVLYF